MRRLFIALLVAVAVGCKKPPPPRPAVTLPTDEPALPEGPGREAVMDGCQMCHSTRYILDQPRFSRAIWTAEVEKMRAVYGAPIAPDRAPRIVDYLVTVNGTP